MTRKETRAFVACVILLAAISVVLSKPSKSEDDQREGLRCITRNETVGNKTNKIKFFYVDEERRPCYNSDGLNNCEQVSLLLLEKIACIACCKRQEQLGKSSKKAKDEIRSNQINNSQEKRKTDRLHRDHSMALGAKNRNFRLHKDNNMSIAVGCACVFILVWSVVGLASYHQSRQTNDHENPQQPMLPVQEAQQETQPEDHTLLGRRNYAGLKESIV